ncbi:MAG: hypothetical protein KDB27_16375, partial [Planctomycetales bacterium]|nr:hypothetical protein [Planctomycetales bacterium]
PVVFVFEVKRKRWERQTRPASLREVPMVKTEQKQQTTHFESECFGNDVIEWSIEEMLGSGVLVKVTAWVFPDMGFGADGVRVNAAITACLWRAVVSVPGFCESWWSVQGRSNEILWIATWALRRARERGSDVARFCVLLPTPDDNGTPEEALRIETEKQKGRHWIVISMCEEASLINACN